MNTSQTSQSPASQLQTQPPNTTPTNETGRLAHPPDTKPTAAANKKPCDVKRVSFKVFDDKTGPAKAWIHIPQNHAREHTESDNKTAVILLSGAPGGMMGPSEMWPSLANRVANSDDGIPVLRLNYRYTAQTKYCIADVKTAMKYLEDKYSITHFILVGWSFGGALVSAMGGSDDRVIACAMAASQKAKTEGVQTMAPRPLLLVHGTSDQTMRYSASQELFEEYGEEGERELQLIDGEDHEFGRYTGVVEEMLCTFIMKHASGGVETDEEEGGVKLPEESE
jgi:alpha/beta superfamily hydrolase